MLAGLSDGRKLASYKIGGRRLVSLGDLERFVNVGRDDEGPSVPRRTVHQREAANKRAEKEFESN